METRMDKLTYRLDMLNSARADAEYDRALANKKCRLLTENICKVEKEIINEREKRERNKLLPTTITVGNNAALASVNGEGPDEDPGPEEASQDEEEAQPQGESSGEYFASSEQEYQVTDDMLDSKFMED